MAPALRADQECDMNEVNTLNTAGSKIPFYEKGLRSTVM